MTFVSGETGWVEGLHSNERSPIRSSRPGSDANERFNELRNGDRYPRVTGKINGTTGPSGMDSRTRQSCRMWSFVQVGDADKVKGPDP